MVDHELFGVRRTAYTRPIPSANTSIQLVTARWKDNRRLRLKKVLITNRVGNQGIVRIWDQDLNDPSVPSTGSAGSAILELGVDRVAASGTGAVTAVYDELSLPNISFQAGIALQVSEVNMSVAVEYEVY